MKILANALALLCIIGCLRGGKAVAQQGWFSQTNPPYSDVFAVTHLDPNTAVAVDSLGRILRSTSGGGGWEIQYDGQIPLYGVYSAGNPPTAVGDLGTILRSSDRGVTWTPQDSGTTAALIGVFFLDRYNGTAVGESGTILHTTDAGATWIPQDSGTLDNLFGVSFMDERNGIAVGDSGTILRTTDGGATWATQDSGTGEHLQAVSFLDQNVAVVVGDRRTVLRTTDGGDTWTFQYNPILANFYGLSFFDHNTGLAVGCIASAERDCQNRGYILRTGDGGITWDTDPWFLGVITLNLYAISFVEANTAIVVGQEETFLRSWPQWQRAYIPRVSLNAVAFWNAEIGLAGGFGPLGDTIMRPTDGQRSYSRIRPDWGMCWRPCPSTEYERPAPRRPMVRSIRRPA